MPLPFLNRKHEISLLRRHLRGKASTLLCLYGRRRCGKSRLLVEATAGLRRVYYVADQREGVLQRRALAREMAQLVPGIDRVEYPGFEELLERWWREAPAGAVLALDEFPWLVAAAPELPSLLQKRIDAAARRTRPLHTILCGSSQRMMLGLLLDGSAPLYGRAREVLRVGPLGLDHLIEALDLPTAAAGVLEYAIWGGVPRYWELRRDFKDLWPAIDQLLLDPDGVLHAEPQRLLADDVRDAAQSSSILSLVGQGCHRSSEVAGRLACPATSLSRPLARLVELGLVAREVPYGVEPRDSKRSLYRVADPFLRFWFRHVEPNWSRLAAGQVAAVRRDIQRDLDHHVASVWEGLARATLPGIVVAGKRWGPPRRFWSREVEIDVVADAADGSDCVLVGEVKLRVKRGLRPELQRKAGACPALAGKTVRYAVWGLEGTSDLPLITADDVARYRGRW